MRIDKITAMGAASIAVAGIGIGTAGASNTAKGVKACVTRTGVLQVANTSGRCPKHTTKVTIAKQGPTGKTGPQGPGAKAVLIDESGATKSQTVILPAGDRIVVQCSVGANEYGLAKVTYTPPTTNAATYEYGTADVEDLGPGSASLTFDNGFVTPTFTAGHSLVAEASEGSWSLSFIGDGAPAITTAHLLVNRGPTSFTLDLSAASGPGSPHQCVAGVQLTPAG